MGNGIWPSVMCSIPSVTLKTKATKAKLVTPQKYPRIYIIIFIIYSGMN